MMIACGTTNPAATSPADGPAAPESRHRLNPGTALRLGMGSP
jgi:hypothetical protein